MNVYCYDIAKYEKKKTLYDKVTNKINKINNHKNKTGKRKKKGGDVGTGQYGVVVTSM